MTCKSYVIKKPTQVMASEKGREDNYQDKSRDDDGMTTTTNVPHRTEEL